MPRERASLAMSMASIERGTLSGSEWAWISTTPFRLWADSVAASRSRLLHQIIDLLHNPHIELRLAVVRQEAVDLLLHIRQLRVTKAGKGGDFGHRFVQAAKAA